MAQVLADILPSALGIAVSPFGIVSIVLILATPHARSSGPAFAFGWFAGVVVIGAILLGVSNLLGAREDDGRAAWVSWLFLALGLGLIYLALNEWRRRPHGGEEPEMPGWMAAFVAMRPLKATAFAVLVGAVNPKNLLLILAGCAAIAQADVTSGDRALLVVLFAVVASLGTLVPVAAYLLLGERSERLLGRVREWFLRNSSPIMAAILLLIGLKLIGNGIDGLS
jgi:hypothetical protein